MVVIALPFIIIVSVPAALKADGEWREPGVTGVAMKTPSETWSDEPDSAAATSQTREVDASSSAAKHRELLDALSMAESSGVNADVLAQARSQLQDYYWKSGSSGAADGEVCYKDGSGNCDAEQRPQPPKRTPPLPPGSAGADAADAAQIKEDEIAETGLSMKLRMSSEDEEAKGKAEEAQAKAEEEARAAEEARVEEEEEARAKAEEEARAAEAAKVMCSCTTPNKGSAGHNQYRCTDGVEAYCQSNEVCYATAPFLKEDLEKGCKVQVLANPLRHYDDSWFFIEEHVRDAPKMSQSMGSEGRTLTLQNDGSTKLIFYWNGVGTGLGEIMLGEVAPNHVYSANTRVGQEFIVKMTGGRKVVSYIVTAEPVKQLLRVAVPKIR